MVTKIIAHNFQSHKHTEVDFKKGLSVFVGDSDQGKTALIKRAFLWCLFNEPNGNSFVRYKDDGKVLSSGERERENTCFVTIQFDNGYELTRKREKNKNFYELINEDGEILSFENFKNEVPFEIQDAIGIRKFIIDDDLKFNVNIIGSRDISLVDLTGSIKSKVIGSFAGTNIIDIANRGVVSDIKTTSGQLKSIVEEKEQIEEKLKKYENIPQREIIILEIEKLMQQIESIKKIKENFSSINKKRNGYKQRIYELDEIIKTENKLIESEQKVEACEEEITLVVENVKNIEKIKILVNKYQEYKVALKKSENIIASEPKIFTAETSIFEIEKILEEVKYVSKQKESILNLAKTYVDIVAKIALNDKFIASELKLVEYEKRVLELEIETNVSMKQIEILNANKVNILSLLEKYKKQKNIIKDKELEIVVLNDNLKDDILDYIATIKELGTCPTCMQPLTEEHLKNIEKELYE